MVAQVVLPELAGVIAKVVQELGEPAAPGRRYVGLPGSCGGIMPVRSGVMPVKKALRPAVNLLGVVAHELNPLVGKAVNVGRFASSRPPW